MIDFIGIGAQKSGTSWAYACLYEHPQICAPLKEIHFFSRPRYEAGVAWYEDHFTRCSAGKLRGEFSTSYLYAKEAPQRIHTHYPQAKIIAILRNPVDRAFSQYRNSIKSGEITKETTFETFLNTEASALEQGRYAEQLGRYYALFPENQILVLVYEDIKRDPQLFMKRIYTFLGIDDTFVSSMLHTEINVARTPRHVFVDRVMHHTAEYMRKIGLDRIVWFVKRSGLPDSIRSHNTEKRKQDHPTFDRVALAQYFKEDAAKLNTYCGRDMVKEWNLS